MAHDDGANPYGAYYFTALPLLAAEFPALGSLTDEDFEEPDLATERRILSLLGVDPRHARHSRLAAVGGVLVFMLPEKLLAGAGAALPHWPRIRSDEAA